MIPEIEDQPIIMVVDDKPADQQLLENMLVSCNFRVLPFTRGDLALKAAEKTPPDVVLLGIFLPGMDGYEVCQKFKENQNLKDIPVIFISGLNETMDKVRALKVGGVDFVAKPYQKDEVLIRLGTHLKIRMQQKQLDKYSQHLEDLVQTQVQEMNKSQTATIAALAKLAESRDDDTGRHIERITLYCQALATKLAASSPYAAEITPEFIEALYYASPLHDIGKIAIADSVLLKPDKLSPEEFEIMKKHTTIGARNLASIHAKYPKNVFVRAGLCIARSHHERWDGTGYPDGAKGEEIALYARIMAVADVYEAMRSNKCYHKALSHEEACEMVKKGAGTQFDPNIVMAFGEIADEFLRITNESADSLT